MLISDMRRRIDKIDDELVRILNQRASIVLDVNRIKYESGLPYKDAEREKYILQRVAQRNAGPLKNFTLEKIFEEILNAGQ